MPKTVKTKKDAVGADESTRSDNNSSFAERDDSERRKKFAPGARTTTMAATARKQGGSDGVVAITTPVVHVRLWLGGERKVVFVFLGRRHPPHFSTLKKAEAAENGVIAPDVMKQLVNAYGHDASTILALDEARDPKTTVKYLADALFMDDSVKAVKHEFLHHLLKETSLNPEEYTYDNLYAWTTVRWNKNNERRDNASMATPTEEEVRCEQFVRDAFRERLTMGVAQLSRDLARYKYGYFDENKHLLRSASRHVAYGHAIRLVRENGGIGQVTVPVGHRFVSSVTGQPLFFDHDPYRAVTRGGGRRDFGLHDIDGASFGQAVGDEDARLGELTAGSTFHRLEVTFKTDVLRFYAQKGARVKDGDAYWDMYFPRRERDVGSAEVRDEVLAEHDVLREWGHDGFLRGGASFGTSSSSSSAAAAARPPPQRQKQKQDDEDLERRVFEAEETGLLMVHLRNATVEYSTAALASSSSEVAEAAGLSNGDFPPRERPLRAVAPRPSSSAAPAEIINLEMVFNLFPVNAHVPLVKYYDGGGSTYKLSRMALHKNVVDARWVAAHVTRRGKNKNARPYVQFVTRIDVADQKILYAKTMLNAAGRLDLTCVFSVNAPGRVADVRACADTVNYHVVEQLNRLDAVSYVAFRAFDVSSLRHDETSPSETALFSTTHTEVANVITNTNFGVRRAGAVPVLRRLPALEQVAAAMNALFPYFALIVKQPAILGGGVSSFYKRTDMTGSDMSWVVAVKMLASVFGLSKDDMVPALAKMFVVSSSTARAVADAVQQGKYAAQQHVLLAQHYVPHVPTVTVRARGQSGFRVGTVLVTDAKYVRRIVSVMNRVLDAAATAAPSPSSSLHSSPFRLLSAEDQNEWSDENRDAALPQAASSASATNDDYNFFDEDGDGDNVGVGNDRDKGGVDDFLDDQIEEVLAQNAAPSTTDDTTRLNGAAVNAAASLQSSSQYDDAEPVLSEQHSVLDALKRADPEVFDSKNLHAGQKNRYATICGSAPKRQPIVVSPEDLARIDKTTPGSYEGVALQYGSTPERAARNRYICPKVWCPRSRLSMTMAQYKAAGEKCPGAADGERPMVFENTYWKGAPRFPGLIGSSKHPKGLCMPCCFLKYSPKDQVCDADVARAASSTYTDEALDGRPTPPEDFKYIKGDTLPLENNRFGMVPTALLAAFNGSVRTMRCGSRDDGSGQFTFNTDCYVRKGIPRSRQSFLQCMADVFQLPGGVDQLVDIIVERITPDVYIAINDGYLCRMFMDEAPLTSTSSPASALAEMTEQDFNRFDTFVKWFRGAHEYRAKMGLDHLLPLLRPPLLSSARAHPEVQREFLIYKSLQRFRAYMQDDGIVKVHNLLLGLFNMRLPWLNADGINLIVFEQNLSDTTDNQTNGDMYVSCEGLSQDEPRMRLSRPFVFVVKQGSFYEPIHRVRSRRNKARAANEATLTPSSKIIAGSIIDDMYFAYDTNKQVRALVDSIFSSCKLSSASGAFSKNSKNDGEDGGKTERHPDAMTVASVCTSAACLSKFLERVVGTRVTAQVIDYTFRLVGLVTANDVYVPLMHKEVMLVGTRAPRRTMYVANVVFLRPKFSFPTTTAAFATRKSTAAVLVEFFDRLAELTGDARYAAARVHEGNFAVELVSGNVVPIDFSSAHAPSLVRLRAHYLDNLNIMVGRQLPDERSKYIDGLRRDKRMDAHDNARIARKLEENTLALRDFVFLRSAFNPFPVWYRRKRMSELLDALAVFDQRGDREGRPDFAKKRAHLVDSLLFGADVFDRNSARASSSAAVLNRRARNARSRAAARADLILSDVDLLSGTWLRRVQRVTINPFAVDEDFHDRKLPVGDDDTEAAASFGVLDRAEVERRQSGVVDVNLGKPRDALLRSSSSPASSAASSSAGLLCPSPASRSSSKRVSYLPRASSSSSSSVARQRRAHRIIQTCGVWQTFQAVFTLVTPGGARVSFSAMRNVMADAIISDVNFIAASGVAVRERQSDDSAGKDVAKTLDALFSDHPSFSKLWPSSPPSAEGKNKKDRQRGLAAWPSLISAMLAEMDSPLYRAGLYDVKVLAAFCGVMCDVFVLDEPRHSESSRRSRLSSIDYGVLSTKAVPIVSVPGLHATLLRFQNTIVAGLEQHRGLPHRASSSSSIILPPPKYAVALIHTQPDGFDLVTNKEALLFPLPAAASAQDRRPRTK